MRGAAGAADQGDLVGDLSAAGVGDDEVVSGEEERAGLPLALAELEDVLAFDALTLGRELAEGELIAEGLLVVGVGKRGHEFDL